MGRSTLRQGASRPCTTPAAQSPISLRSNRTSARASARRRRTNQRALAEALAATAAALTSTLSFDDVLDRILIEVGRVVPHDAARIILVEGGLVRVVRSRGYADLEPAPAFQQPPAPMDTDREPGRHTPDRAIPGDC